VKAVGAAVVLQRRQTPVVFRGDGEVLEHWGGGGWRGVTWQPQIGERPSADGSDREGWLAAAAWQNPVTHSALPRWG
jgi:hypothetical protein